MFDLEYDKAKNSLSRIALLRKHTIELKMVCKGIDLDEYIANEAVSYDLYKRIRNVRDESNPSGSKRKRN